jgi:hypothetical protein
LPLGAVPGLAGQTAPPAGGLVGATLAAALALPATGALALGAALGCPPTLALGVALALGRAEALLAALFTGVALTTGPAEDALGPPGLVAVEAVGVALVTAPDVLAAGVVFSVPELQATTPAAPAIPTTKPIKEARSFISFTELSIYGLKPALSTRVGNFYGAAQAC